ncbi:MAG TPA: FxLYD domain-containing protein [Anaerolineae bacterium]|nr:FxLYD domain-containing protein [Anaerolineae bacterium]HNU03150.1 FxLYD domain-containing protein [Anaerolineae bacterium]
MLCAWFALLLTACGQVVTRPTAQAAATRTPTATLAPPGITPTATPDTYIPPPTATPTATPEPIIHSIQPGENLYIIAARYDVAHDLLRDVNGIENERALQVGQQLLIPVAGWGGPAEPTPTVTPTPWPAQVENVYFHPSPLGELTVLGEVVNASASDLEQVVVQIALYDDADRLLASQSTTVALDVLAPGQRSPFAVLFTQAPERYASYQATVLSAVPAYLGTRQRQLEPVDVTLDQSTTGMARLSGRLRNNGAVEAFDVSVVATLYDPLGRVVGTRSMAADPPVIAFGGGEATFQIELVPAGPVSSYTVQVQARRLP